jgi:hypothetical protein
VVFWLIAKETLVSLKIFEQEGVESNDILGRLVWISRVKGMEEIQCVISWNAISESSKGN